MSAVVSRLRHSSRAASAFATTPACVFGGQAAMDACQTASKSGSDALLVLLITGRERDGLRADRAWHGHTSVASPASAW